VHPIRQTGGAVGRAIKPRPALVSDLQNGRRIRADLALAELVQLLLAMS
jgi:hypothetical protein